MDTNTKRMSIAEFRELGLLQEVNRVFFHPLGLALFVAEVVDVLNPDGSGGPNRTEILGGIFDCRDDPEGIFFDDAALDHDKTARVRKLKESRSVLRLQKLGYVIQPVGE